MAQKTVWLPEIGELTLAKRRGTRNIRLSISPGGRIRVGLPAWLPYSAGITFAQSRKSWIIEHKTKHEVSPLKNGDRVGKSYRLRYQLEPAAVKTSTRLLGNELIIRSNKPLADNSVQTAARAAAERAMRKEAEKLLPPRLNSLAARHGFKYNQLKIKKMTSRWGSCSSHKVITLNFFLMQLPWPLIDYVLLHELVHTRHLDHSPAFWKSFEAAYPNAKAVRKQIRDYQPVINSVGPSVA